MSPERKVCAPASLPSSEVRRRNNMEDLYTVAYMARLRACWRVALRIRRSFSRTLMRNSCQRASWRGLWRETTYVPERNIKTMLYATTRLCQCSEPKPVPPQEGDLISHSHQRMGKPDLGAIDGPVSSAFEDG